MFYVRIVNVDFYSSAPIPNIDVVYSEFRGAAVSHVPVIRIFGSSQTGQKTCLHIHGVFPYIYIPFDGLEATSAVMYQTASQLDKAINVSLGQASSNAQHVYKIILVSGKPLYGYHVKEHQFLKIYFYNPLMLKKASVLLQNGSVLGKIYQPHEVHIPYILQFMIDYNLHGMGYILLSDVHYRVNPESDDNDQVSVKYLPDSISKISVCQIEADALSDNIMNRLERSGGDIAANPGIACIWEEEKQRRRNNDLPSQISPCQSQEGRHPTATLSHIKFKKLLREKLKLSSSPKADTEVDPNTSVYPAETPSENELINASFVDINTPQFSQNTNISTTSDSEITLTNESLEISVNEDQNETLVDPVTKNLLAMLEVPEEQTEIEGDSMLSQFVLNDESDSENEADLSLPLASLEKYCAKNEAGEMCIPQLDGNTDTSTSDIRLLNKSGKLNCFCPQTAKRIRRKRRRKRDLLQPLRHGYVNKNKISIQNRMVTRSISKSLTVSDALENSAVTSKRNEKCDAIKSKLPQVSLIQRGRDMPILDDYERSTFCTAFVQSLPLYKKYPKKNARHNNLKGLKKVCVKGNGRIYKKRKEKFNILKAVKQLRDENLCQLIENGEPIHFRVLPSNKRAPCTTHGNNQIIKISCSELNYTSYCTISKPMSFSPEFCKSQEGKLVRGEYENRLYYGTNSLNNNNHLNSKILPLQQYCDIIRILRSILHRYRLAIGSLISHSNISMSSVLRQTEQQLPKEQLYSKAFKKQLQFLDGANDSSTSEDECSDSENIKAQRRSPYDNIPVALDVKRTTEETSRRLYFSSGSADSCRKSSIRTSKKTGLRKHISRRKLHLDEGKSESNGVTINEENIVCRLQSKRNYLNSNIVVEAASSDCIPGAAAMRGSSTEQVTHEQERTSSGTMSLSQKYASPETYGNTAASETKSLDIVLDLEPRPSTSKDAMNIQTTKSPCQQASSYEFILQSNSHSSSDLITPYQKPRFTQYLSVYHPKQGDSKELSSDGLKAWIPKFNPPAASHINETVSEYNIPNKRHAEPYYSDPNDVQAKVEIGHRVLKVKSNASVHVPDFCSSFQKLESEIVNNLSEDSSDNLKTFQNQYYQQDACVVTPVKQPPKKEQVNLWLTQNVVKLPIKQGKQKRKSTKIHIPLSPEDLGNISNESLNISLTPEEHESSTEMIPEKQEEHISDHLKVHFPLSPGNLNNSSNESLSTSSLTPKKQEDSTKKCEIPISPVIGRLNKGKKLRHYRRNSLEKSNKDNEPLLKAVVQAQFLNNLSTGSNSGEITGATMNNTFGFKMSLENLQNARALTEHQYLTTFIMELHVQVRGDFKPDPQLDPVRAIFFYISNDVPNAGEADDKISGICIVNSAFGSPTKDVTRGSGLKYNMIYADSELNLINRFVQLVQEWDPDIFIGYEIEMLSWGYLINRGFALGFNLPVLLSRTPAIKCVRQSDQSESNVKDFHISGRIVLDLWRLMRHEIALQSYTFENVVYHILHQRVPQYSFKQLSHWWEHKNPLHRCVTADYYMFRVKSVSLILNQLDFIGRTSELARLFGIQFFEVLSRGSQFRVESMMLRLAKPLNFIPVSPSVEQRAKMRAPEFLPLILEPESKFYCDPVIVLDFQSLYPSMIIAYNYCFSTCIGRVEHLGKDVPFQFGATQLKITQARVKKLLYKNKLNFSPCGVGFVKPNVRLGILPRMLKEILDTRLMVKKSMKENSGDKTLCRVLHSRQLGLKLIANVTYGYTSANFSGRMPCVEVGDSVVSKGRETLQQAIDLVDTTKEWGAKVIYGDTDSLFVLVTGKSRADAFQIGAKIAEMVTKANPRPVKLKLEKVYQPCILQTKKRYVGYMYESPDQKQPSFDAKGIETVRRDGCPASSKILEKSLKMLFDHCDMTLIKRYILRQFDKIIMGRISIQELTFAKEYRGASGYRPGACVPALELTRKWTSIDKRNEPRSGERVPYVIVNGPPGLPLIKLVRSPYELLNDASLRLNALYYITKVIIPPLNRCFNLLGVDVGKWFNEMPRRQHHYLNLSPQKKSTISHFFSSNSCAVCGQQTHQEICEICKDDSQISLVILQEKAQFWESRSADINLMCQCCSGQATVPPCISLDCPILYQRFRANMDLQQVSVIREIVSTAFDLSY